ncbi:hypothetical protein E4Z66_03460 [Aliishimia ponticola]|uniref:Regulator of SigK n=1 Tax=Aliishimia ponticola TaxID=2499833 RepID=A0A4S4NGB5_9RHOB|nr:anti-sigma factor [Aliishimia ponticola]THH38639.1 hypothetical protein E4Z66_03460 [Aliishimia ponticola]
MSETEDHSDDIALAGEYVLHLLNAADRRAVEARLTTDPVLRRLVRDFETQFAPMAEDIPEVVPPAALKARIEARLFDKPRKERRSIWRWILGGTLAIGVLAGALVMAPRLMDMGAPAPAMTATVAAEDGSLVVAARFIRETGMLDIERQAGGALPGRVLELWLIADGAEAPVSLGVLPPDGTAQITVPAALAGQLSGGLLAISDEPPGGSPTGAPTGAVLAAGPVIDA